MFSFRNINRDRSLGNRISLAGSSDERRQGLLCKNELETGSGLWIVPCEAVHTFRMKFHIDVLFLDRKFNVVKLYHDVPRSRVCFSVLANSVLELPAGTIEESGTKLNDWVEFRAWDRLP